MLTQAAEKLATRMVHEKIRILRRMLNRPTEPPGGSPRTLLNS